MDFLTSNSFSMMEKSMDFLWTKQTAILDNIANAETPNYKAKYVTFEEDLRQRLNNASRRDGKRSDFAGAIRESNVVVAEAQESTRMDENGVTVTEQNVELVRNAYQLQYVMNAMNSDLRALRTAIKG